FPDSMTPEQIQAAVSAQFSKSTGLAPASTVATTPEKPAYKSTWRDPVRAGLQGMTFGWSDEIGSAVAAPFAAMATGRSVGDAYRSMQAYVDSQQRQYREESPGAAIGAELLGGVLMGGAGGATVLGSQTVKSMASIARAGVTSLLGAAEGGIYGGGQAQQGERMGDAATGAAVGAVAAPLLGYAGEKVANGVGHVAGYIGAKITETPQRQATRLIRDTVEKSGLTADDVVQGYRNLGPQATLMDVDDNLLAQTRS